jgi:protein pelota
LTIQVDRVLYSALAQSSDAAAAAASDPASASSAPQVASSSGTAGTTTLHISGRITSENEHVKKGAFHTLDLEMGRDFTVIKGEGEWDSVALERLQDMTEPGKGADVGAIVCGEGASPPLQSCLPYLSTREEKLTFLPVPPFSFSRTGVANICIITNHTTIIRQRIEVSVPRKRKGGATALGADKVRFLASLFFHLRN